MHADLGTKQLWYEIEGEGPAVVLAHAGIADSRMWDAQVADLARDHRVLRYDLPGYGRSTLPPGPFSHVDDLARLLELAGIGSATVVGCSLGGRVALELALERPELVDALVLVAPGLPDHEWSEEMQRVSAEEDELFDRGDLEAAADLNVRVWVDGPRRAPAGVDADVRERVREMCLESLRLHAAAFAGPEEPGPGARLDPPASARLGEVAVPTLVVTGDADVDDILEICDRLAAGIPGARKVVVPGAAHALPLERPDELNRELREFLATARQSPAPTGAA